MDRQAGGGKPTFEDLGGGRYRMTAADGTVSNIDQILKDFLESTEPSPNQASLEAIWARTSTVHIYNGGVVGGRPRQPTPAASVAGSQLVDLQRLLRVTDVNGFHCMCIGSQALEFRDSDDSVLAVIGLHHGISIRWDAWSSDAMLEDGRALAEWLAVHGAPAQLNELLESDRQRAG